MSQRRHQEKRDEQVATSERMISVKMIESLDALTAATMQNAAAAYMYAVVSASRTIATRYFHTDLGFVNTSAEEQGVTDPCGRFPSEIKKHPTTVPM